MSFYSFEQRHNGPDTTQTDHMLKTIGIASVDELIRQTIPSDIRFTKDPELAPGLSENEYLRQLRALSFKNKIFRSYIGMGYYNTHVPGVIQRNIFENPGWYTAYTPYQAEIAQGRMEALLNFQTMVCDLTGMELANASLLDEATSAAEAMHMFFAARSREQIQKKACRFFVASDVFPQTLDVLKTRSAPLGIELVSGDPRTFAPDESYFAALLQYPGADGGVANYHDFVERAHKHDIRVAVAADLMSLALLTPPGEWGADCVVGTTQRFGVPPGFGGPHAAYFATREEYKRDIPGRIIGVSVDASGQPALRMALQTREQHIKRDKATSNICTAQVLLAVMASMYAVYHGPQGIKAIAETIHRHTVRLYYAFKKLGYKVSHEHFFDTLRVEAIPNSDQLRKLAEEAGINFHYPADGSVILSMDETVNGDDVSDIIRLFARAVGNDYKNNGISMDQQGDFVSHLGEQRRSNYLLHPVFNAHHSETKMLRYIKHLESKDLSLTHSMIALGSCTMKLNATSEMVPLSWAAFSSLHPFVPTNQAEGYLEMIHDLEKDLCAITGFDAMSLQPNSGAQGEYAGLMVIRDYFISKGEGHRNIALIPSSAHGTNPASAVMAGMKVVVVKCDDKGNIDIGDLRAKAETHRNDLAALMVTYPSTHGVYEEGIREITKIIHDNGGQVYMDGANMNAQVGLTSPGMIGADVCHLNLHKTFAIPHGGGGPGVGPIGVARHLSPFLPGHSLVKTGGAANTSAVSAAPWGSASILLISYGYIKMMGGSGLKRATELAILNANYIKARLEPYYPILYKGTNGHVAHEMILDCRAFKQSAGIEVPDMAKRLMDYGFHAPTVSFPVAGTLMVEPTESESLEELDRFCEVMIAIRKEIEEVEKGQYPKDHNVLVNSPHTVNEAASDQWNYSYSREKAVFPLPYLHTNKFWPSVKRVDNAFGDRNLVCTCPEVETYADSI